MRKIGKDPDDERLLIIPNHDFHFIKSPCVLKRNNGGDGGGYNIFIFFYFILFSCQLERKGNENTHDAKS